MANINSEKFAGVKNFNDPSAWVGGTVPTGSGDVAIIESGFTQINVSNGVRVWTGVTSSIAVDSTSGFPTTSGSFYSYTYQNSEYVKIDYDTVSGNNFISCSIDHSYVSWSGDASGSLRDGKAYGTLRNNAPVFRTDHTQIEITGSNEWVISQVIVRDHGCFRVKDTAKLKLDCSSRDSYVEVEDAKFEMTDQTSAILTGSTERNSGLIYKDNFDYACVKISGSSDLRTRTTVASNVASASGVIPVASSTGFAAGDFISLYSDDDLFTQKDNRDGTNNEYDPYYFNTTGSIFPIYKAHLVKDEDEVLHIRSISGNNLYVSKIYATEGTVISSSNAINKRTFQRAHGKSQSNFSGTKTSIQVRSDMNDFEAGQKVLVGNNVYTILEAAKKLIPYKDIDFTAGANLDEFYVDTDLGSGSEAQFKQHADIITGSRLEMSGSIVGSSAHYKNFYLKNTKLRDYKLTLTGSLIRQETNAYGTSGSFNGDRMVGMFGNSCPYIREKVRPLYSQYNYARASYMVAYGDDVYWGSRNDHYGFNDTDTLILSSSISSGNREGDFTMEMEAFNEFMQWSYQGQKLTEGVQHRKAGAIGIQIRKEGACIKRFTVEEYIQELVLDTSDSISADTKIYLTGTEVVHSSGQRVVKLASTITDMRGFKNISSQYALGTDITTGSCIPTQLSNNGDTDLYLNSSTTDRRARHSVLFYYDTANDAQYQVDASGNAFWDMNLGQQVTLDAIGIGYHDTLPEEGVLHSVSNIGVEYSNDGNNWSEAKATAADPRLSIMANDYRIYTFSQITAKFLRIHTGGTSKNNRNYIMSFGIYNFNGRGNTIEVNNASDININDTITFFNPRGHRGTQYHRYGLYPNYRSNVLDGSKNLSDYVGNASHLYTVTGKSGNVLTLDRLIEGLEIHPDSLVLKLDRAITVKSEAGNNGLIPFGLWYSDSGSNTFKGIMTNIFVKSLGNASRERMYFYAYPYASLFEISNCSFNYIENGNPYFNDTGQYRKNNVWLNHDSFNNQGSRMYKDHKVHGEFNVSSYTHQFRNVISNNTNYTGNFISQPRYMYINNHSTPYDPYVGEFCMRNNYFAYSDYINVEQNVYSSPEMTGHNYKYYDNIEKIGGGYYRFYKPMLRTEQSNNQRVEGNRVYPRPFSGNGYLWRTEANIHHYDSMGSDYIIKTPYYDKHYMSKRPFLIDNSRGMIIRNRERRNHFDFISISMNRISPNVIAAAFTVYEQQSIRVQQKMTYKHDFGIYFDHYLGNPQSTNNDIKGLLIYNHRTLKGKGAPKSLTFTDFDFDESFTAEPGNYLYILLHRNRNYCQRMFTFKNMSFNVTGTDPDKIEIAANGFEEWKLLNRPDRLVTGTKLGKQKIPKKLASRGTIKLRKFKF